MYGSTTILCTMYLERRWDCLLNFSILILFALMCTQSPYNFTKVIKYQTFQTPFYNGFELMANILFSFKTNFGLRSIQIYQTVAILEGN